MKLYSGDKLILTNVKFCKGFSKIIGLMFSKKLGDNEGLILNKASGIHMLFVFLAQLFLLEIRIKFKKKFPS